MELKNRHNDSEWVIGGDFNAVKNKEERKCKTNMGNYLEREEFSCFIKDIGLEDVPCKGKKFSWFNGDGRSKSRLYRFLVSNNILNWWGVVGQHICLRGISNHCSVWLVADRED